MIPIGSGCPGQPETPLRRKSRWRFACVALLPLPLAASLLLSLVPTAHADTTSSKTDAFLKSSLAARSASGWSSVIAKLAGPLTPEQTAQIKSLGGYVYRSLPFIESAAVRVPAKNLQKLAQLSFVLRLSSDATVVKNDEFTVEHSGAGIAYEWCGLTGAGVTVAVLDGGMNGDHGDLEDSETGKTRVLADVSFVAGDSQTEDKCGHGMHVAGIIAGNGNSSDGKNYFRTFYGVARKANLVNVRVLDDKGQGDVSGVIKGIEWCIVNKAKYNIRVLNLSLGHLPGESYITDPLCQAVEQAYKAGIVVVCAAGNNGRLQDTVDPTLDNEGFGTAYGTINSPGNSPYVITVGAMKDGGSGRESDRIATYSSRGPSRLDFVLKPDIVAPGNRVIALNSGNSYLESAFGESNAVKQEEYVSKTSKRFSVKYYRLSGTSMAAPVVAGAVALMLQKDPSLSPDTVKARLMVSATKWTDPSGKGDPCTYGAGYLDIPAALSTSVVATQPAISPTLSQDDEGNVYLDASQALWGDRAIWGTGIDSLHAVWGTHAIWGTNILESSRALWGTTVWFDRALWGTSSNAVDLTSTAITGEE